MIIKHLEQKRGSLSNDEASEAISWLEKLDEQKPANNVEAKFHEGDWVIYNKDICQIVKREEGCNKLVTIFGIEKELVNERNLSTARLWTIQDAKDGDVLVSTWKGCSYIYIFKEVENNIIMSHIFYYPKLDTIDMGVINIDNTPTIPATKEQRDILFAKIKEAKYEWDAKNKQLKKIKQKPTEWSKEDEKMLDIILNDINYAQRNFSDSKLIPYDKKVDWLKFIKYRVQS